MENKASMTSLMSAFGRAYHNAHAQDPIFRDTMAGELMTDAEYRAIGGYILSGIDFFAPDKKGTFRDDDDALRYLVHTQIAPTPLARAAWCEDALRTAVHTGVRQYVILGAGLDTFAYREPYFCAQYPVFEVDHPQTQADKRKRLTRAGIDVPDGVHYVPLDFTCDNLFDALLSAGYNPKKKTFFSWLGVSMYLDRTAIEHLLDEIAAHAPKGSSLVFDYASAALFLSEDRRVQNMLAMAQAGGEAMRSSFDPMSLERMAGDHGFLVHEHLMTADIQKRYFANRDDDLSAFPCICFAHAVVQ